MLHQQKSGNPAAPDSAINRFWKMGSLKLRSKHEGASA
jgi:hypothetical protein